MTSLTTWTQFVMAVQKAPKTYRVSNVCTRVGSPPGRSLEVCVLIEHRPDFVVPVERFCLHFGAVVLQPNVGASFATGYDIEAVIEASSALAPGAVSRSLVDLQRHPHEFVTVQAPQVHDCETCCS